MNKIHVRKDDTVIVVSEGAKPKDGDVVIKNVLDTGADVVTTRNVKL